MFSIEKEASMIQLILGQQAPHRSVANMPKTLWEVWQESWRKSLSIEDYTQKYAGWIKTLWQHKTMDLWNTATPSGVFGERY
jgi:hypothetical protein